VDPTERMRTVLLSTVVRDLPRGFWSDLREGAKRTYADVFQQVRTDPLLVDTQRIDLLYQYRHCRMENLLHQLAKRHNLSCSPTLLQENGRFYVLAAQGDVIMTQSYVPTIGAMPKPAQYLKRHAAVNEITRSPQLGILDEPTELFLQKGVYGLLAHNPVGKRFAEADQRLGMIQFCIPVEDHSAWAAELLVEEILDAYDTQAPSETKDRRLPWRDRREEEEENKG
jgi:hypothetical protein